MQRDGLREGVKGPTLFLVPWCVCEHVLNFMILERPLHLLMLPFPHLDSLSVLRAVKGYEFVTRRWFVGVRLGM